MKSDLEKWIFYDHNPFIIFSDTGKVIYFNEAGEYLLSFVSPKIIYETIILFAPKEPKMEYIKEKFIFGNFNYDYALIGYEYFEEIGVRFYKNTKQLKRIDKIDSFEEVNIFFLLEFAKTYSLIDKDIKFIDVFDPDIPDIMFEKDILIRAFSDIYKLLSENKIIKTEVKIKIGEHIVFEDKKYQILEVAIFADNIKSTDLNYTMMDIKFFENKISILFPLILKT